MALSRREILRDGVLLLMSRKIRFRPRRRVHLIQAPAFGGWTPITDPNPDVAWTPSLSAGVDYWLKPAGTRSKKITVTGGRHVYMAGFDIDIDVAGGPIIDVRPGSVARTVYVFDTHLHDTAGVQTDAFRGTNGAGGNIDTGAGGTILKIKRVRVDGIVGSNSVAPAVHADGIQLPGGIKEFWAEDCTFKSGYVGMQLQRELFVTGDPQTITAMTRTGTTGDITCSVGLDIAVGDWVEVVGANPTSWRSAWQVLSLVTGSAPNVTRFTVFLGDGGQAAWTSAGTVQRSAFVNYVGSVVLNRVNIRRQDNTPGDPAETLTALRLNAGRPDAKGSNAEDRTPALVDGMPGTFDMHDFWVEPNAGETLADMLEPADTAAVYSLAKGLYSTVPNPNEWTWPDHPKVRDAISQVVGAGKVFEGVPPGGDYAP